MRSLLAILLGGVVIALVAWLATYIIDNTALPNWLGVVAWVIALIAWLVWSFPRYVPGSTVP